MSENKNKIIHYRFTVIISIILVSLIIIPTGITAPKKNTKSSFSKQQEIYRISRLARKAESDGKLEHALDLWEAVIAQKPNDYSAYRGIQRALVGLERYDEALKFLDAKLTVKLDKQGSIDPIMIHADRVGILFLSDTTDQAEAEIEKVLNKFKGFENVYTEIANVLFGQRLEDQAASVIQRGRKECKNPYLYAREMARWFEARMNWHGAIEEYLLYLEDRPDRLNFVTGAVGDMPENSGADSTAIIVISKNIRTVDKEFSIILRRLMASLHFKAQRYEEALAQYKLLDKIGHNPGQELLEFAGLLMSEGEYLLSWDAYNEVISANFSDQAKAHANLGKGHSTIALGEIDTAAAAFSAVLIPGSPPDAVFEAYESLGRLELDHNGSPERARKYFESALKTGKKASISRVRRDEVRVVSAITWAKEGDLKQAKRELKAIVRSNRAKSRAISSARLELTLVAFRSGDLEEMHTQANSLLASDPSSEFANDALMLTALLTDLKDAPEAIRSFGRADFEEFIYDYADAKIILDSLTASGNPVVIEEALWRLSRLEIKRNRIETALEHLNNIINLGESALRSDLAIFTTGKLYEDKIGNTQIAADYYERLLVEHPDSPLVDQARRRLSGLVEESS
ncbi:MAG: tetratricopeptide repeat protein [Candidatus Hatepunaea meridiana]|nr:tetratricopeptide repeat protein [Candidatus Hatepunaea meridiana]